MDPITIANLSMVGVTGLTSLGTKLFGGDEAKQEQERLLREQKLAQIEEERRQKQLLAQAQTAQQQQQLLELSRARRNEQVMILVGIGGLAVLVSGVFLYAAFKKGR